jgi:hypothetical protein
MSSSIPSNPLPFANVQNDRGWSLKRDIISWYVPYVGVIKMYINPQSIIFSDNKILSEERTKGGFVVSYFSTALTTISINGNTGTSGIEGINVLHEIYMAEQHLFDQNAALINAVQSQNISNNIAAYVGNQLGGNTVSQIMSSATSILDPMSMTNLNPRNTTTLADVAFGIEMYYSGTVYRGYFKSMRVTEVAENFLVQYVIEFVATSKRGYRLNTHPWQRSPEGPSNYNSDYSYDPNYTIVSTGTTVNGNNFIGDITKLIGR